VCVCVLLPTGCYSHDNRKCLLEPTDGVASSSNEASQLNVRSGIISTRSDWTVQRCWTASFHYTLSSHGHEQGALLQTSDSSILGRDGDRSKAAWWEDAEKDEVGVV
jgi:hypothetical protein